VAAKEAARLARQQAAAETAAEKAASAERAAAEKAAAAAEKAAEKAAAAAAKAAAKEAARLAKEQAAAEKAARGRGGGRGRGSSEASAWQAFKASVPAEWVWPLEGDVVEVEVVHDQLNDGSATWIPAEVLQVLIDGQFQARIVLPDGSDQWDDWFSWKEEGTDWRRRPNAIAAARELIDHVAPAAAAEVAAEVAAGSGEPTRVAADVMMLD